MSQSSGDNPRCGQLTATSTPASLGNQACTSVLVQNDQASANNLLVGDSSHQFINLAAGQALTIPCSNINEVYVATASGNATCNFLSVN
jgi:hypothetical protein